ncbi:hypothetical protein ACVWY0_003846 [Arthrobacter sp. UYNi723]
MTGMPRWVRLTRHEAVQRIRIVDEAVSHGREEALACGVSPDALDFMAKAFEGERRARATDLCSPTTIDLAAGGPAGLPGEVWVHPHIRRGRFVEGHFRCRAQ